MNGRPTACRDLGVRPFATAVDLPLGWDDLCDSLLQKRSLLRHYERSNPCGQRYYGLHRDGQLVAGAVVYSITQDLFSLRGDMPSRPVAVNIVGLPASIPPAGVVGDRESVAALLDGIFARERGLTVALNVPSDLVPGRGVAVRLLPDLVLPCRFDSLASYEHSLRASWRRRMRLIRERFLHVETLRQDCTEFSAAHYALYRDVLARADQRLEVLGPAFFRGLPRPIELVSCYGDGKLLCWRLVLVENGRLTFVLGGHDYGLNPTYASYFNNLYGLLEDGLRHGVREIDLGQTAEDAKARMGATAVETTMLLNHSNRPLNHLLRLVSRWVAYRRPFPSYHVFKEEAVAS